MLEKRDIQNSIITKYRSKIWSKMIKAIEEFELIQENDRILVCISGGKDSMLLAKCLEELQKHGKIPFEIEYVVMNPGYQEENLKLIQKNLSLLEIPATIFESNIFDIANKMSKDHPCYLCARMRRGALYHKAKELHCNKIALGHHLDDVAETILMNLFFTGQFSTMMPKLHSDHFEGMELIRPLYYVREQDIKSWAKYHDLTFIDCACKFTKKQEGKRLEMKRLLEELEERYPNFVSMLIKSTENVILDTLLGYKKENQKHSFLETYSVNPTEKD